MTHSLDTGTYKITSLSEGDLPIGVNRTIPAFQYVYVDAPVHEWKIVRVCRDRYRLSVDGYHYVGVLHGKVLASVERCHAAEWIIEHQERQNAYTITLARESELGWTVPDESSDLQEIEVRLVPEGQSFPPYFSPKQLFLIKKSD